MRSITIIAIANIKTSNNKALRTLGFGLSGLIFYKGEFNYEVQL